MVCSGRRQQHIDPFGEIILLSSRDGGESWSAPRLLTSTPLDNRDPGVVRLRSGEWLVTFFSSIAFIDWADRVGVEQADRAGDWAAAISAATPQQIARHSGKFAMRYSTLEGGELEQLDRVDTRVHAPHGPVELDDGRLLLVGIDDSESPAWMRAVSSEDEGRSWQLLADIAPYNIAEDTFLHEPHLVETGSGRLLTLFRTNTPDKTPQYLYTAWSDDGGCHWSEPVETAIEGVPPHLLRCTDGTIVLTYAYRRPPYSIRVVVSHNHGEQWSAPRTLVEIEEECVPANMRADDETADLCYQMPDFGYPATVQLPDGKMVTVYYGPVTGGERIGIAVASWYM